MFIQLVKFESGLSEEEVRAVAEERAPEFRALPDLIQKFYLKLDAPDHYGGLYVWRTREAMLAYRESALAKSIPEAYDVVGAPQVEGHEVLFPIYDEADSGAAEKAS